MKRTFTKLMLLAALLLPSMAHSQMLGDYSVSVSEEEFVSIASSARLLSSVNGDYGTQTLQMPFAFPFGDSVIAEGSSVTVRADGYLYFGTLTSAPHNPANIWSSTSTAYQAIAPYPILDGKVVANGAATGAYALDTVDDNGDSLFVVEWKGVSYYGGGATGFYHYQLRLHANGNVSAVYNTSTIETNTTTLKHNFFMVNGLSDKVCLAGSWASPVMVSVSTLPDLMPLPDSGTVITYVRPASYCPRVTNLVVANPTSDGATVSWTGTSTAQEYIVECGTYSEVTTDTTVDMTGLDASTAYMVKVRAICGADDTSAAVIASCTTACEFIAHSELPFEEGFENYNTGSFNGLCWTRMSFYNSYSTYPTVSSYYHSETDGTKCLNFYPGYNYQPQFLVLPGFDDLSDLVLSFKYTGSSYVRASVGYMTDPSDTTTFVALAEVPQTVGSASNSNFAEFEQSLGAAPATAHYPAIRVGVRSSYGYNFYIDEVSVYVQPDCDRPASVSLTDLTTTSATVVINDPSHVDNYSIRVIHGEDTTYYTATDTAYAISGLEEATEYKVVVATICNDGTVTRSISTTFRTPCEYITHSELPYENGFESYNTGSLSDPCWTRLSFNTSYSGHPNVSSNYRSEGSKSLYFYPGYSYQPIFVALPGFDDLSDLMISFKYMGSTFVRATVGYMTNPNDTTTFVALAEVPQTANSSMNNSNFTDYELSLSGAAADAHFPAIRVGVRSSNGYGYYIDEVMVGVQPACVRPVSLDTAAISANSATIIINDPTHVDHYMVYYGTDSLEVFDTVATLTVEPSRSYSVSVVAICNDGTRTRSVGTSFMTPCVDISVAENAYDEDFESWSTVSAEFNQCWDRLYADFDYNTYSATSTYRPVISTTSAHNGSTKALRMYSYNYDDYDYVYDEGTLAFMPVFEASLNTLYCSFWFQMPSGYTDAVLAVGVSSSVSDTSTFTRLMTIRPTDGQWHQYEMDLSNYTGTGNRITFFMYNTSDNYDDIYGYIDDIHVEELGDCYKPAFVTLNSLTANSAEVAWYDPNSVGSYKVVVNGEEENATFVSGDTVTTLALDANTEYTVAVSTLCDGEYTDARTYSFRTPCTAVASDDLPWTENFDVVTSMGNSSAAPVDVPCLTFHSYRTSYYHYPRANSSTRFGDSGNSMSFYTASTYIPQIMVLPLFEDDLNTLQLSFQARKAGSTAALEVGTMTNPNDTSTFVPRDTIRPNATNTWEYQEVRFGDFVGTGYIAIRPLAGGNEYIFVDNLTVAPASECIRVASVVADSITSDYVHLTITDPEDQNSYTVEIIRQDGDTIREYITTLEFSVDTLTPASDYTVNVYTVCSDATTAPVTITFSTPCAPMDMPFVEDFDAISDITALNCWERYTGLYDTAAATMTLASTTSGWARYATAMGNSSHVKLNVYGTSCKYWLVSPTITVNSANAVLGFDYALTAYNSANAPAVSNVADDRFCVLITTNDGATWEPLATWGSAATDNYSYASITNTVQAVVLPLAQYDGQNVRIAFYGESTVTGGDNDLHIDNVVVESLDCMPPTAPAVVDLQAEEVTLTWTGSGNFEYKYAPAADTSNWTTGSTTDTSATITTVSNTEYIFMVRTDCGNDGYSRWYGSTFRTACTAITTLPWTEDFEGYTGGSYSTATSRFDDPCWTVLNRYSYSGPSPSANYPYIYSSSSYAHSGSNSLNLYGNANPATIVALPLFDTALQFSFWMYCGSSYSVQVGYMTNPNDESTFVSVQTCQPAVGNTYQEFEVMFPDTAAGSIAIRYNYQYSGYSIYLDDFTVDLVPSCARPSDVTVSNIGETSATVTIADPNNANHYSLVLSSGATVIDSTVITGTTHTYTTLSASTEYSLSVRTVCDDGTLTRATATSDDALERGLRQLDRKVSLLELPERQLQRRQRPRNGLCQRLDPLQ